MLRKLISKIRNLYSVPLLNSGQEGGILINVLVLSIILMIGANLMTSRQSALRVKNTKMILSSKENIESYLVNGAIDILLPLIWNQCSTEDISMKKDIFTANNETISIRRTKDITPTNSPQEKPLVAAARKRCKNNKAVNGDWDKIYLCLQVEGDNKNIFGDPAMDSNFSFIEISAEIFDLVDDQNIPCDTWRNPGWHALGNISANDSGKAGKGKGKNKSRINNNGKNKPEIDNKDAWRKPIIAFTYVTHMYNNKTSFGLFTSRAGLAFRSLYPPDHQFATTTPENPE